MSKYLLKIIAVASGVFLLVFGGNFIYRNYIASDANKLLYELKSIASKDALSLDRGKVLGASLNYEVYSVVLTSEGSYSLLQTIEGKIIENGFDGQVTAKMPDGELVAGSLGGSVPEFTLADGKKTAATIVEPALTVLQLKTGEYLALKITKGEVKSGRLTGITEARTVDSGNLLYLAVSGHEIAEGYITPTSIYISPITRLSAFIVLKETEQRHQSLITGAGSKKVLAAETGLPAVGLYNFENNILVADPGIGAYHILGGVGTTGLPINPAVINQINQVIAQNPLASTQNLIAPQLSYLLLGPGSITTAMLQNASITADKLAAGVVTTSTSTTTVSDGAIITAKLADSAVTSAKISDGTITTSDLASSLTFGSSALLDLSAITHSSTSQIGLILPNVSSSSPSNPSSGKGYLAYDTADKQVLFYNGSAWGTVGSGTITSVTAGNGLSGGGSSGAVSLAVNTTDISSCTSSSTQKIIWDSTNNRFTCGTDQTTGGSASSLSSITNALSTNTLSNGDLAQIWNWSLTTAGKTAFKFGESSASTAIGTPYILGISTLTGSTANPLLVTAGGTSNGVKVDTTGLLSAIGTGGIQATTLNGATFAAPGAIGGTTPGSAAFTTISASGQITSTVSTGTAPFVVSSTTNIPNLNASSLSGATFAAPGSIGSGTPGSGAFTTISASSTLSANGGLTIAANQGLTFTSGTGTVIQNYSNTTGTADTLNVTNSGSSGTNTVIGKTIAITGTINGTGSNTTTGINFANVAAATNNTYNALTFGTGFNNFITSGTANLTAAGALSGLTTLGLSGAITGATATNTINGIIINSGAVSGVSTLGLSGAITGATATNTINGLIISSGALSGITTINASGQFTSTLATGTAPFVVASTTNVANLNASSLNGATFAAPGSIGSTTPGSGAFTTLSASSTLSANGGLTLAANQNLLFTSGTGTLTQNYSNTTGTEASFNHTNSGSSGTNASTVLGIAITGTANAVGSNTITGLNFPNVAAATNNSYYGLVFGTGLTDILRYNGTQIISGTGVLQSAGISGSYGSLTGTGALASGSIASGFGTIATGNTITGTTINGTTGINTGASSGTQRIDATGNLVSIGNITGTGAIILNTTGNTNGVTINTATGASGNSGAITIQSGGTSVSGTSGNIAIDVGAGVSANGTIGIGTANSGTITIGRSTQGITLPGFTGNNAVLYGTTSTGVLAAATTSTSGLCLISGAATGYVPTWTTCPGGGGSWSQLTAPSADLSLAMAATHTTFTWGGNTGVGLDMFKLTDNATNTGTGYILDVAQVAGSAAKPLKITQGANTLIDTTSGGALTLTSAGAATWGTTTGNLTFQVAGTGTTGNVQIGAGGGGSATPDFLVVDQATGALPAGTNGAIALDSTGKFNIYEGAWKVLCNKTDLGCGTGTGAALSAITAATAGNTINNGDNAQVWNWQLTTLNKTAFSFGENVASTATGNPYILGISTLTGSTANPLIITAGGTANGVKVDTTGLLQAIGTGGIKATTLGGATFAAPGAIGSTTPGTGAFTTLSATGAITAPTTTNTINSLVINAGALSGITTINASGQITSTLATGTAPFVVASTTNVANLNASSLNGATFASPGAIGSTTAGTGAFTTLSASSTLSANGGLTIAANQGLTLSSGTGTITQGYTNSVTGSAHPLTLTNSNASITAANVKGLDLSLVGATNANVNANTITGINFGNVTPIANNAFNGITFGTGFNNFLTSGTINVTAAGAITGATGVTLASGNFDQSVSAGTFSTGTGAVSLNGLTTLAAGKALVITGGAGSPTATTGTVWYDTTANKFKIVENGVVKILCNTTDLGCGTGGGSALSGISAATAGNTINNGDNAQVWNWQLSTAAKTAFSFSENLASINGAGSQYILGVSTLTGSTANPLIVTAGGTANGVKIDTTGLLQAIGTGGIKATDLATGTYANALTLSSATNSITVGTLTATGGTINSTSVGATTPGTGAFTTLSATGAITGPTATNTINGVIISSGAVSGVTTLSASGLISANGGITLAANQGLTFTSGTGTLTQNYSNTTGTQATLNHTNSASTGTNTSGALSIAITGTANAIGSNTITGLNFPNVVAATNNTYNGITFGTGFNNYLTSGTVNLTAAGALSGITTINASGQITSTLVTGTAPFVVASTTNVANLNASSLNGATFAAPGGIGSGTPGSGAFTTFSASGALSANGGLTVAANQGLTFTSGTGTLTQSYSNTTGTQATFNHTNSASTGTNISKVLGLAITGTANALGSNTITGIDFANVVAATNNTYYALSFGTGLTDILRYNGTQIISGTGILQSAGLSGTYSNALTLSGATNSITVGTLTATGGSINGTTVGATTPGSGAFTTLSATGAVTGATVTNTINGIVINSGAVSSVSTLGLSGAIAGATATNTINGIIINSGAVSGVTGLTFSSGNISGAGTVGSGATTITSASTTALAVGANGVTNPVLQVDASTVSVATGLKILGAATGGTTALSVIDSGINASLSISGKGTGTVTLASGSTGNIQFFTSSNSITSGGNLTIAGTMTIGTSGAIYATAARPTRQVTLAPEYPGAVLTGSGTSNTGTMTSDFCSNTVGGVPPNTNTTVCNTSGDTHNYYNWTTTQGTAQSYDIWIRWRVPDNFSGWAASNPVKVYAKTNDITNGQVKLYVYDTAKVVETNANGANMSTSATAWVQTSIASLAGTYTAGSFMTIRINMNAAATTGVSQVGEITLDYLSNN